jgi:phage baseplate assembly protein W
MQAIYRGIAFPFKKSAVSLPAAATDEDLIKQSLVRIVLTGRGERIMRPDFGSTAYAFVFENNDLVLQETIRTEVLSAISKFETRVIVRAVDVSRSDNEVFVTINYVLVSTRQEQTVKITMPTN